MCGGPLNVDDPATEINLHQYALFHVQIKRGENP
jgi:hypothetical protein